MPTRLKPVTLWPCLHTAEFEVKPGKGDFLLCTRCDDYREVMAEDDMRREMSPEEIGSAEGTVGRGAKAGAKYRRRKTA